MRVLRWLGVPLALLLVMSIGVRARQAPAVAVASARAPIQPVPYSHKQHIALGLQCQFCHVNPNAGALMTFPPATLCMSCHTSIATDRPSIRTLTALAAEDKPIPWVRVYRLPDYVFWKHGPHLNANVTCAECHGPVAERDVIAEETDIVTMRGCMTCHEKRQVYSDCGDCHAPRQ